MECIMKQIPTRALLLAGVSSENTDILATAWNRCLDDVAIANALQVVCETGQTEMVVDMLRRGARIGKESVWAACRSGKWDTIKVLIEGGANITDVEVDMLQSQVAHFVSPTGDMLMRDARLQIGSHTEFIGARATFGIMPYASANSEAEKFERQRAVDLAKWMVESPEFARKKYNLIAWNCECFAWVCKTGDINAHSHQVARVLKAISDDLRKGERNNNTMVLDAIASAAAAATLAERASHPSILKLGVQVIMWCGVVLTLKCSLTLAESRIRRCSGHGDFKTAVAALLPLLELAATRIGSTALHAPIQKQEPYILMRKADKAIARTLHYYNTITKLSAVCQEETANRIVVMPSLFLNAALDTCERLVSQAGSQADNEISPRFHQLYIALLIRACDEDVPTKDQHLTGLVHLFAATPNNAASMLPGMKDVSAAVGQDGRGMLLYLLAKLPDKLSTPCSDMFLHLADACTTMAVGGINGLPVGAEVHVIQTAMDLLLDGAVDAVTATNTLLRTAVAEPAYARDLAAVLQPHLALAPSRKLARDLLLTPCSSHIPAAALQQLVAQQHFDDKLRIVCALVTAGVPADAVLPLTQVAVSNATSGNLQAAQTRLFNDLSDADKAAVQEAVDVLCRQVNQDRSCHPAVQLLLWLCTTAVTFQPSLDQVSTAMGVRILLSSRDATLGDIGCLAFVYPKHCWVKAEMHWWMFWSE
eukprot:gene28814-biopygen32720